MAQRIILVDDLTQKEGDVRSVSFGLEDKTYTIDLTPESFGKLEKALKPFIDAATPAPTVRRTRRSRSTAERAPEPKTEGQLAREWLTEQGITDFPPRGKLRKELLEQYRASLTGGEQS
jgi:hypothetical protein